MPLIYVVQGSQYWSDLLKEALLVYLPTRVHTKVPWICAFLSASAGYKHDSVDAEMSGFSGYGCKDMPFHDIHHLRSV